MPFPDPKGTTMSKTFVYEESKTFLSVVPGEAHSLVTYVGLEQYEEHPSEVETEVVISDGQNNVRFNAYGFARDGVDGLDEFVHRIATIRDALTTVIEATQKAVLDAAEHKVSA